MNIVTNSVQCSVCAEVKKLGVHNERGQHNECAFVDGTVKICKDAKTLLKKVDKHRDSGMHAACALIISERGKEQMENAVKQAQAHFMERHKENIEATTEVFRIAYECAQSHLSFREHSRLVELHRMNGVECGDMLYSFHACANIVSHIASCMRDEICEYLLKTKSSFSIMIDESTSVANVHSLILYARVTFNGEIYH